MNIQYAPGIPSSDAYPYAEFDNNPPIRSCRYDRSTSVGVTTGYGRIKPLNETLLKDVIAAQGPVSAGIEWFEHRKTFFDKFVFNSDKCRNRHVPVLQVRL